MLGLLPENTCPNTQRTAKTLPFKMENVRVRFAPSPTGPLHIGGVRTALYNYLFAKKLQGTFILRIEDTDQTRFVDGAEAYIQEALAWLGIAPQEGQGYGGDLGPYRQSERKALYKEKVQELVDAGHAYYAFDTAEELQAQREELKGSFKYGIHSRMNLRNSLTLPETEVKQLLEEGVPHTVRMKIPENETIHIEDMVRGTVSFDSNELDDKVILKADGMPTYHLANIVDDHGMKITHVIRGEEWLPSTAHHVLLYRFFGWSDQMPQFAHLPLILKPAPESFIHKNNLQSLAARMQEEFHKKHPEVAETMGNKALSFIQQAFQDKANLSAKLKVKDKDPEDKATLKAFLKSALFGKLSKRDGDRLGFPVFPLSWKGTKPEDAFVGFREFGFDPKAVINFLAFLGWNPGTEQEIFSLDELVEAFSAEKIGKAGARFNFDKAKWFNQQYLSNADNAELAAVLKPIIAEKGHDANQAFLMQLAGLLKGRVTFIPEFWEEGFYFFERPTSYDEKTIKKKWKAELRPTFDELYQRIENVEPFSGDSIKAEVEQFMEDHSLKFGDVLPILRLSISGLTKGPSVFESMELLGKEEVLARMQHAYQLFDTFVAGN